jgi:hypothetical protein
LVHDRRLGALECETGPGRGGHRAPHSAQTHSARHVEAFLVPRTTTR